MPHSIRQILHGSHINREFSRVLRRELIRQHSILKGSILSKIMASYVSTRTNSQGRMVDCDLPQKSL
jgi:hypothetical protein